MSTLTSSVQLEQIGKLTNGAARWIGEGNIVRANSCLSTALMNCLSFAATSSTSVNLAESTLHNFGILKFLKDYCKNLEGLGEEVSAGRLPSSVIGGNYSYQVFAHMAWLLNEDELGENLVRFSNRADVMELSTPFWNEYAKAMLALVERQRYTAPKLEGLVDLEMYWVVYLPLIEAATCGGSLENAITIVDRAFIARNQDKSLHDDSYATEGMGICPVKWDYRRDGLLSYISRSY